MPSTDVIQVMGVLVPIGEVHTKDVIVECDTCLALVRKSHLDMHVEKAHSPRSVG